jgi:DNA-binding LytR/AlgR family response regulator
MKAAFDSKTEEVTNQVNIAICDDDNSELEKIKSAVETFIALKQHEHQIAVQIFTNGNDLLSYISRHGSFDLLILDIIMPGINGLEIAEEIRSNNSACKIIFLTSSPEFAVHSYKVRAFYYFLKPFSDSELIVQLEKALDEMAVEQSSSIIIKGKSKLTRVQIHKIRYLESVKHVVFFHLHNNEALSCYGSMEEFHDILLADNRFVKCHKSFIVNMNYVISISKKDFVLADKTLVPISKQVFQQVKNAYINYFFEKERKRT